MILVPTSRFGKFPIDLVRADTGNLKIEVNPTRVMSTWVSLYRVTIQVLTNLPLTSKQKFCYCLRNFYFKVNGRFVTS